MWIQGGAGGALRAPHGGRLGQRDELMLDQKTSEGFWESVPKATGQCGLQEHPSNKQQPWSALGDCSTEKTPQSSAVREI